MIYYEIRLFTNKSDGWNSYLLKGEVRGIKWLKYGGDDANLQIGEEREDEYLATRTLLQNMGPVEKILIASTDPGEAGKIGNTIIVVENEDQILELLHGQYEKVTVLKYWSDMIV